ncbi:MAG: leucine-rich repeat domain-containing protein [Muribaculaceae bacterium]|nr:leucine-rich repeat domain-containing protein [Muribaculaceae bacterium]
MKKLMTLFLSVALTELSVLAYDFEVEGVYYNVLPSATEVEVTCNDENGYYGIGSYAGSIKIPATVTHEGIAYNVTAIGDNAFAGSSRAFAIEIPDVASIGRKAFHGCTVLRKLTIPTTVKSIGEMAFSQCNALKELVIPAGVSQIGSKFIMHCAALTTLTVDAGNVDYCSENNIIYNGDKSKLICAIPSYSGDLVVPATVKEIGDNAFAECDGLSSIDLANVETIGEFAFFNCARLISVTIPSSIKKISRGAFMGCPNLKTLTLGSGVTEIASHGFYHCRNLASVDIQSSELKIGDYAFASSKYLTLKEIPSSVSEIGDYAFSYCIKLPSMKFADSVRTIGSRAFIGCSKLAFLEFGNAVESIADSAFYKCDQVRSVAVTTIVPPAIGPNTFAYVTYQYKNLTVPYGAVDDYANAENWNKFVNIKEATSSIGEIISKDNIKVLSSEGCISISGVVDENATVVVYDVNGRKVVDTTVSKVGNMQFSPGIYIVVVEKNQIKLIL